MTLHSTQTVVGSGLKALPVLIWDLHPCFGEGIRTLLELSGHGFEVVSVTCDADELLALASSNPSALFVLSVCATDRGSSIQNAMAFLATWAPARVAILACDLPPRVAAEFLRLGVTGLLSHHLSASDTAAALRLVGEGEIIVSPSFRAALAPREVVGEGFSPSDVQLLSLLGTGMKSALAASALHISESTLRRTLKRITRLLGATSTTEALVVAARKGLI